MKAYRLSRKARLDLDDIWDYSRELWGAMRGAAYRRRPVGSHMILYRLQDGVIMVVRVLHQNMDATRALSEH